MAMMDAEDKADMAKGTYSKAEEAKEDAGMGGRAFVHPSFPKKGAHKHLSHNHTPGETPGYMK